MIGSSTIIEDIFVLGIQLGVGPMPGIESGIIQAVFSAGVAY